MDNFKKKSEDDSGNFNNISFRTHGPGDIGYIIYLHGILYAEEYGFDLSFDLYVAEGLANFIKNFDPNKECLWVVEKNFKISGSIAIVKAEESVAQLRWFLLTPETRGMGIGKKLVKETVDFCKDKGYSKIILWTFDELDAARGLYKNFGFKIVKTEIHEMWGQQLTEELWELDL